MSTGSTTDSGPPAAPPQKPRGKRDVVSIVSAAAAVLGVVVAIFAWKMPESPPEPPGGAAAPGTTSTTSTPSATRTGASAADYLETIPVRNAENLVELPRAIRGRAEYLNHPVIISCPTNETGDTVSEVVWPLDRRYVDFQADVRPFYPEAGQQRAVTHVTALRGVRQPDTSFDTHETGSQKAAEPGSTAPLTADVEGADTLHLRVECDYPTGTVILTNARLTRA